MHLLHLRERVRLILLELSYHVVDVGLHLLLIGLQLFDLLDHLGFLAFQSAQSKILFLVLLIQRVTIGFPLIYGLLSLVL